MPSVLIITAERDSLAKEAETYMQEGWYRATYKQYKEQYTDLYIAEG
ncbi:hypothetical protein SFC42_25945 [Priestia filamentosa]